MVLSVSMSRAILKRLVSRHSITRLPFVDLNCGAKGYVVPGNSISEKRPTMPNVTKSLLYPSQPGQWTSILSKYVTSTRRLPKVLLFECTRLLGNILKGEAG